ncbi:MAG: DUF177 domain-containing protein [Prevotellaceae bacterium]|nr:DUF177 domain-containing protein [Prevotellaceae bacterium]
MEIKSLPKGKTIFELKLDNSFFAQYENVDINSGSFDAKITVDKRLSDIELTFELKGTVKTLCDRCLEEMSLPIEYEEKILAKFGKKFDDSEEVIVIDEADGTFDVSWLLYEMVATAIPPQHSHNFEQCNEKMMEQYNKYIVSDENDCF